MKAEKVLFITQEVAPYIPDTEMGRIGLDLPQYLSEHSCQTRNFMPRWGVINERRNQLHEVQRLSGMNIIIDESDHTLVIKVASVPVTRAQVYFIDNDDYFHKRGMLTDEQGNAYEDNAERAVFFARGVLETVKKFRWVPDVIHCQGWMSLFAPLYIRTAYKDDPPFTNPRIVFSPYGQHPESFQGSQFSKLVRFRSLNDKALRATGLNLRSAITPEDIISRFCDAYIQLEDNASNDFLEKMKAEGKPVLDLAKAQEGFGAYSDFYDSLLEDKE